MEDWESVIKDRMRPCATICKIEDARKRNSANATRRWREKNMDHYKQKKKEWEKENPEKMKIYNDRHRGLRKQWAENNHERVLELQRKADKKRRQTEKRKAWEKEYRQRPEVKARRKEYDRKRQSTPERKAYERERSRKRRAESKMKKEAA